MEIQNLSSENKEFSRTFWQHVGRNAQESASPALIRGSEGAGDRAEGIAPRAPNRGGDKYPQIDSNSLSGMDLGFIHPSSGVDYLCFGVYGHFRAPHVLESILDYKRREYTEIRLCGVDFELSPGGLRDGIYYPIVLTWHGVKLLFLPTATDTIAPVRVHVPGLVLLQCDWRAVVAEVFDLLERLSFFVERTTVSRVDLQVTLAMPFGSVASDMRSRRVVTDCRGDRVSYDNLQTGETSTVWYRSRTVELCAYNKTLELQDNKAGADYFNVWNGLYGTPSEPLSRIEFRLRSDALRRWGVTSLEDLDDLIPSIADRLTSVWFRVLKSSKVRGHENEAELSACWTRVRAAFLRVFDGSIKPIVKRQQVKRADPVRLVQQARGCIAAAVPFLASSPSKEDLCQAFEELTRQIGNGLDDRIQEKCREFFRLRT